MTDKLEDVVCLPLLIDSTHLRLLTCIGAPLSMGQLRAVGSAANQHDTLTAENKALMGVAQEVVNVLGGTPLLTSDQHCLLNKARAALKLGEGR